MIRAIAAIDEERGIANDHGIPWDLPDDRRHFRKLTAKSTIIMGYGTYTEFSEPLADRHNLVAVSGNKPLKKGFEAINDINDYLANATKDVWVIGGGKLFNSTLHLTDELHLTQLQGAFGCTKFFPEFKTGFRLAAQSPWQQQNNICFCYQTWLKK